MEVADQLTEYFRRRPNDAVAVYLFGSFARGTATSISDVDVAVLFAIEPESRLQGGRFELEDDLRGALGRDVQLVSLGQAPPDLIHRVLRDGKLVYETDRSARIAFEVRARNEYFDLLPHLLRYRQVESP